jgi:hypothetical protein
VFVLLGLCLMPRSQRYRRRQMRQTKEKHGLCGTFHFRKILFTNCRHRWIGHGHLRGPYTTQSYRPDDHSPARNHQ